MQTHCGPLRRLTRAVLKAVAGTQSGPGGATVCLSALCEPTELESTVCSAATQSINHPSSLSRKSYHREQKASLKHRTQYRKFPFTWQVLLYLLSQWNHHLLGGALPAHLGRLREDIPTLHATLLGPGWDQSPLQPSNGCEFSFICSVLVFPSGDKGPRPFAPPPC